MSINEILSLGINNDMAQLKQMSQNIANVNTPGYLKQQSFQVALDGTNKLQSDVHTGPSAINNTNNNLDLAMQNEGFLLVEKGNQTYLTRAGRLQLDTEGWLKHLSGGYVMGEGGRINIGNGDSSSVSFGSKGEVIANGVVVDALQVVKPATNSKLAVSGEGLYRVTEGNYSMLEPEIVAGALNSSAVKASEEMVKMIEVSRHLQTMQKAALAYDQLLNAGINELGRR